MKKIIIYLIIFSLIFAISFYIGAVINSIISKSNVDGEIKEEEIAENEENKENVEETVSEEENITEHYVLREKDGLIQVYTVDDEEKEELYISTDIATEYLPEIDKINLKSGIHLYNRESLYEMLQDFE